MNNTKPHFTNKKCQFIRKTQSKTQSKGDYYELRDFVTNEMLTITASGDARAILERANSNVILTLILMKSNNEMTANEWHADSVLEITQGKLKPIVITEQKGNETTHNKLDKLIKK